MANEARGGLPADVVEKAEAFLKAGTTLAPDSVAWERFLALLSALVTPESIASSIESLARQAAREEASVLLAAHRCQRPAPAPVVAEVPSTRPHALAPAPEGSLGARLVELERERRALIDRAILDVIGRAVGEARAPRLLSTEIARALEHEGARLPHVEVVDGLLRLVRARRVSTDAGFYWVVETATEEARA